MLQILPLLGSGLLRRLGFLIPALEMSRRIAPVRRSVWDTLSRGCLGGRVYFMGDGPSCVCSLSMKQGLFLPGVIINRSQLHFWSST